MDQLAATFSLFCNLFAAVLPCGAEEEQQQHHALTCLAMPQSAKTHLQLFEDMDHTCSMWITHREAQVTGFPLKLSS